MLHAPNIQNDKWYGTIKVEKSPLPYNDRRRFGSRLKRLHQLLKSLPPSRYDHRLLVSKYAPVEEKKPACGSVACAFGHAAVSGQFKDLPVLVRPKVRAKPYSDGSFNNDDLVYKVDHKAIRDEIKRRGFAKIAGGVGMKSAADIYFGPGSWNAIFEFDAVGSAGVDITKTMVMNRIKLVAKNAYGVDVAK